MKVVIYARYSSDRQTEQSIEGQLRVCREYCEREGYEILGEYCDRATSAYHNVGKRSEFLRMISDSENGEFEAVLVYKLDRFSRSKYDSVIYKKALRENGVRVISATEQINNTPSGEFYESIIEANDQFYSAELGQKAKRGMRETAIKHNVNGPIPYGYENIGKKIRPKEPEASVVRRIFSEYASGKCLRDIDRGLEADGVKTKRGVIFNDSTTSNILRNIRYDGIYSYDGVIESDEAMRIVDHSIWEKANARILQNTGVRARRSDNYLLAGRLFCSCGKRMYGKSSFGRHGERHYYYVCPNDDVRSVTVSGIEDAVAKAVRSYLTDEWIDRIARMAYEDAVSSEPKKEIDDVLLKIESVKRSTTNLRKTLETLDDPSFSVRRINELSRERARLEAIYSSLTSNTRKSDINRIRFFLHSFVDGKTDKNSNEALIDSLVERIVYDGKCVKVLMSVSKEKEPPEVGGSTYTQLVGQIGLITNPAIIFGSFAFSFQYSR